MVEWSRFHFQLEKEKETVVEEGMLCDNANLSNISMLCHRLRRRKS